MSASAFPIAVFAAVRPLMIILPHPFIQVKLYLLNVPIYLSPKSNRVKLFLARLIKPLAYTVALWRSYFCPAVFYVFKLKVQRVLMVFTLPTILAATISEDTQKGYSL